VNERKLPVDLEPFRHYIERYTFGAPVEEWLNDTTLVEINAPRALIACNVKGMVTILSVLAADGVL
jgi:hypothetical protein